MTVAAAGGCEFGGGEGDGGELTHGHDGVEVGAAGSSITESSCLNERGRSLY